MNPQPNSREHPEVIKCMKNYQNAVTSYLAYQEEAKRSANGQEHFTYTDGHLFSILQSEHEKLIQWCDHYGIEFYDLSRV